MKKLLLFLIGVVSLSANAQVVNNIDEADLLGEWVVTQCGGDFDNLQGGRPTQITFKDNGFTTIKTSGFNQNYCAGFFVGNLNTKLHFLCINDTDGYFSTRLLNYRIHTYVKGSPSILELYSYDWKDFMRLEQITSGVQYTRSDEGSDSDAFDLKGVKTGMKKGVHIKNGRKYLSK